MSNSSKSFRSSSVSSLSLTTPPRVEVVEIDESPHPNRSRSRSRSLSTPLIHRPKARRETVVIHREPAHSNSSNSDPGEPQTFELTRWMEMKLDWNIKDYRNVLASLFTWLLLAGFIVLPGTFASIRNSQALNRIGKAGKIVVQAVQNLPLLWVAGILCLGGACGISWLWWENYDNYIWLVDRIFFVLNSIVGLITTLVNIHTAQDGDWSVTSIVTAVVTGTYALLALALYLLYAVKAWKAWKEHDAKVTVQ